MSAPERFSARHRASNRAADQPASIHGLHNRYRVAANLCASVATGSAGLHSWTSIRRTAGRLTVTIRNALQSDVSAIASIHVLGWQAAYRGILPDALLDSLDASQRATLWNEWFSGPGVHTLVACGPSSVIGFSRLCPARPIANPPLATAEITHIYVHPDEQASGVGRRLLEEVVGVAREEQYRGALLWVLEANGRARRFYERFGFTLEGARRTDPGFLGSDSAEVRYVLTLQVPAIQRP